VNNPLLVFPAIDLLGGLAVRLSQGRRESATVYSRAPWTVAAAFAAAGAPRLHVVDLDAAFSAGQEHNQATIERIAAASSVPIEVGGGLRTVADCERLFALGARYAVLGTAAVKSPELLAEACRRFPGRIVVAVDARGGLVAVEGWQEGSTVEAAALAETAAQAGAAAVLYTDIARDGMQSGPDLEATARLARRLGTSCPVIASGGVAQLADLDRVRASGAFAVIVGRAIYEGAFTVPEAIARAAGEVG
jgi:phosphoribosylformimino-5-aminoimidazole carboxamide ribotide isomerase